MIKFDVFMTKKRFGKEVLEGKEIRWFDILFLCLFIIDVLFIVFVSTKQILIPKDAAQLICIFTPFLFILALGSFLKIIWPDVAGHGTYDGY
jgi:hypothetical protein